ncbi:MAG: glutamyl-tRNA reductase [Dehalococcoidia bacterium]|nr:glutamyl-tRNA reductase [Dehalococcoidia bacterium]
MRKSRLFVIGLNHHTAPLSIRERVAVVGNDLAEALRELRPYLSEGVILSTCNRTEIYGLCSDQGEGALLFLQHRAGGVPVGPHTYEQHGTSAARHLLRVTCGLDSMVVGEPQILGQVRTAEEAAQAAERMGPILSRLFSQALIAGKRARNETDIGKSAASFSYAGVEIARNHLGALAGKTLLLIGAGEMSELAAKTLRDNGIGEILVLSRTAERAQALAEKFGGLAVDSQSLAAALLRADVVISSTDSPRPIIRRDQVEATLAARGDRPLVLLDMAVPRDIEPEVDELPGAHLYDIDDLGEVVRQNLQRRHAEGDKVNAIIDEELREFFTWWGSLQAVPAIRALQDKAENVRQSELAKMDGRLGALSEAEMAVVDYLTKAIANKILHKPIVGLKSKAAAGDQASLEIAKELLGLQEET